MKVFEDNFDLIAFEHEHAFGEVKKILQLFHGWYWFFIHDEIFIAISISFIDFFEHSIVHFIFGDDDDNDVDDDDNWESTVFSFKWKDSRRRIDRVGNSFDFTLGVHRI